MADAMTVQELQGRLLAAASFLENLAEKDSLIQTGLDARQDMGAIMRWALDRTLEWSNDSWWQYVPDCS